MGDPQEYPGSIGVDLALRLRKEVGTFRWIRLSARSTEQTIDHEVRVARRISPVTRAQRWGKDVFRLMTSFNHGALWGMGQGYSPVFALLSIVAAVAVVVWLFFARGAQSLWLTISLSFVMAGTLGNLYDRLGMHGLRHELTGEIQYAVRDFLYFEIINWPIFNFADTFLVTGAIMLVIQSFQADMAAKHAVSLADAQPAGSPPA